MDSRTSKLRATQPNKEQKFHLLQFLEDHTELANDKYESSINGAHDRSQQWIDLPLKHNSMNGANKTGEKWRKYWQDQRSYVKERNAIINSAKNKTGVHSNIKELSEYEKSVTALITIQAIIGDTDVIEFGDAEIVEVNLSIIEELPKSATVVSMAEEPIHKPNSSKAVSTPSSTLVAEQQRTLNTGRSSSYRKRNSSRNEKDEQFDKFLKLEESKLEYQKEYKQKKLELMEKIAKKQNEMDEAKINALNNLKEAIININ